MSHPNIVTVHDVGHDGSTHYIVMEMIDGQDLKKIIKARGALPHEKALDYAIQICAGLGFAHRSQLVHADVKPQNLLINPDGVLKVADFGIAQAYADTLPQMQTEVVWGSPHYFAPEQARGEKPSPSSDVYSIGVVLFEMFTGRLPYVGASQSELALAHIRADVPRAIDVNPDVPKDISAIIAKVMSKRPNDRYKRADQLGHILRRLRERPPSAGQKTVQPAEDRPARPPTVRSYAPPSSNPIPNLPSPVFNPDGSVNTAAAGEYTGPLAPKRQTQRDGLDCVTLILAGLAFIAVAGLLPLYLFGVFPALA